MDLDTPYLLLYYQNVMVIADYIHNHMAKYILVLEFDYFAIDGCTDFGIMVILDSWITNAMAEIDGCTIITDGDRLGVERVELEVSLGE